MSTFHALKQSLYHRVAVGPFEMPVQALLGSDIVLHLPVLEYYASLCEHVTEFGVRDGHSTVALISGCKGVVHSYDIEESPAKPVLKSLQLPCKWEFHLGDTGSADLQVTETDLLFLDTLHTYDHLSRELLHHGRKARKFLAFHDTFTCGAFDLSGPDPRARGILPAIEEFIQKYPGEYETCYRTDCNNGLWILRRT